LLIVNHPSAIHTTTARELPLRHKQMSVPGSSVLYHGRLVQARLRDRFAGTPIVGVVAGTGSHNFGDELMFAVLADGLPDCRVVEIQHPETEHRLVRVGLSGARFFSGVVVGGGTLMNAYFLPRLLPFVDRGIPLWSVGTGVGSAGFGVPEAEADPSGWAKPLRSFRRVTVRGPHSEAQLRRLRFDAAEVVGDLALARTPSSPVVSWDSRRLLVNLSGSDRESDGRGEGMPERHVIAAVGRGLSRLKDLGWQIVPFALHDDDLPRLALLGGFVGGWPHRPVRLRSRRDAEQLLDGARGLIGMRLHAAALGWMSGVPTLGLGYRSKTLDFADYLDAADQVVDLRTTTPGGLTTATLDLIERAPESSEGPYRQALAAKRRLCRLMAEINRDASAGRVGRSWVDRADPALSAPRADASTGRPHHGSPERRHQHTSEG
jgi:polysaccharide pyruvyl transferase WcaK-like protein